MVKWSLYAKHHAILWWHFFSLRANINGHCQGATSFSQRLFFAETIFPFSLAAARGSTVDRMLTTTWASILMNKMFLFMFHTSTRRNDIRRLRRLLISQPPDKHIPSCEVTFSVSRIDWFFFISCFTSSPRPSVFFFAEVVSAQLQ